MIVTDTPTTPPPPPPPHQSEDRQPVWKRWWLWAAIVVVLIVIVAVLMRVTTKRVETIGAMCPPASPDWIDLVQRSGFFHQYRDAVVTGSGYVRVKTAGSTAYYVAFHVEGVEATPVFSGTRRPTSSATPGLLAAANDDAEQLSDLHTRGPDPSLGFTLQMRDPGGIAQAEACFRDAP